jgi:GT2 family glycosyltransferase
MILDPLLGGTPRAADEPADPGHIPPVVAIIVNYGHVAVFEECISSVFASKYPNLRIVLVDNGSPPWVIDTINRTLHGVQVIRNSENRGYAAAINQGLTVCVKSKARFAWVLNNDVIVSPDTLSTLVEAAHANVRVAVVGSIVRERLRGRELETCGFKFSSITGRMERLSPTAVFPEGRAPRFRSIDTPHGCSMLVRADVVTRCGGFWERLNVYFEETELCLRLKQSGFTTLVARDAVVYHTTSATMDKFPLRKAFFLLRNLFLMQQRRLQYPLFVLFVFYFAFVHVPMFLINGVLYVSQRWWHDEILFARRNAE